MNNDDTPVKDPEDWKSGDDPMTDAQRVYLDTLAGQAGEPTPGSDLSKAEANEKISALRQQAERDSNAQSALDGTGVLGKVSADDDYGNNPDMATDVEDDLS